MEVQAEASDLLQVLGLGFAASVPTWSSVRSSPDGRAGLVSRLRAGLEGALHRLRFPCLLGVHVSTPAPECVQACVRTLVRGLVPVGTCMSVHICPHTCVYARVCGVRYPLPCSRGAGGKPPGGGGIPCSAVCPSLISVLSSVKWGWQRDPP